MTRSERKAHKKFLKEFRKRLVAISKEATPYNWLTSMELFITSLEFMKQYYERGINVISEDPEGFSRKETLIETLKEYELFEYHAFMVDLEEELKTKGKRALKENHNKEKIHWSRFWNLIKTNMREWWD